jgi:hypothetical protein
LLFLTYLLSENISGKEVHLVVQRHGGVEGEVDVIGTKPAPRRLRQASVPLRHRVAHVHATVFVAVAGREEEQAVAMVIYASPAVPEERTSETRSAGRGWRSEELRK